MKNKIKYIIDKRLSFLRCEEKEKIGSDLLNIFNTYNKELNDDLITKNNNLVDKNNYLINKVNELDSKKSYLDEENKKLSNNNEALEAKVQFLINELNGKFSNRESQTIAYQLGSSIIKSIKKPKEGFKEIPSTSLYLLKETLNRKSKNRRLSKFDKVLNIVFNTDDENIIYNKKENSNVTPNYKISVSNISNKSEEKKYSPLKLDDKIEKNHVFQILGAITNNLHSVISRKNNCYLLNDSFESQVISTKSDTFLIESSYEDNDNIWAYGLFSNNSEYPKTERILQAIEILKDKKLPIVFLDKSLLSNFHDFDLLRQYCDIILCLSQTVLDRISGKYKKILVNNYFDERYFYPEKGIKSKEIIFFLANYENTYLIKNLDAEQYTNNLRIAGASVFKHKAVDSQAYSNFDQSKIVNFSSNRELIVKIRDFEIAFSVVSKVQDYIPQEILCYLACGIPTIVTDASFINEQVRDFLTVVNTPTEVISAIDSIKGNKLETKRRAHLGYRYVMNNYTSEIFINSLYDILCSDKDRVKKDDLVTIMMATKRDYFCSRIIESLVCQSYDNIELVIITQDWDINKSEYLEKELKRSNKFINVKVIVDNSDITLGERLNICAENASSDSGFLAKMDDDDFYFENYLSDMLIPFKFGNFDMTGKCENFIYLESSNKLVLTREDRGSYRNAEFVAGPTLVIKKATFNNLGGFKHVNNGEDSDLIKRLIASGRFIYSCDPFNFIQFRSKNVTNHTWQVDHKVFEKSCTFISDGLNKDCVTI